MTNLSFSKEIAIELFNSGKDFPVDLDQGWVWLGYSSKQKAKDKLVRNFEQEFDYYVINQTVECADGKGLSRREKISLSLDCFKQLGMMAGTAEGKKVRKYFLECESEFKTLKQLTPIQMIAAIAQYQAEQEQRQIETQRQLDLVKSDVATIKQIQLDAELALKELPPATKPVPVKTTRSSLNKLIREYCHKTSVRHNDAWRELYREFKYRFHIDLSIRAANGKSAPLDVAESLDVVDDLYALACEMFKGGEK